MLNEHKRENFMALLHANLVIELVATNERGKWNSSIRNKIVMGF